MSYSTRLGIIMGISCKFLTMIGSFLLLPLAASALIERFGFLSAAMGICVPVCLWVALSIVYRRTREHDPKWSFISFLFFLAQLETSRKKIAAQRIG